jgi:predicted nucleotidyltransferase
MDDAEFTSWLTGELASLAGVTAVALGGSRAQGTPSSASDWDFAVYYRGRFDPDELRAKRWSGTVSEIGGWGGGVMNGGAWLTIDDRRVDVHYRDLDDVEHWCGEASHGRFDKQQLLFYVAGIPTYVVMAELATNVVLAGHLPRPEYPEVLSRLAARRWRGDAIASLDYGRAALQRRGDVTVALANTTRSLIEASHARLAHRRWWVLNEKGLVEHAGLGRQASLVVEAIDTPSLLQAIDQIRAEVASESFLD